MLNLLNQKGKKKWQGRRWNGLLPISSFGSRHYSGVVTRKEWCATGRADQAHGLACVRTTGLHGRWNVRATVLRALATALRARATGTLGPML